MGWSISATVYVWLNHCFNPFRLRWQGVIKGWRWGVYMTVQRDNPALKGQQRVKWYSSSVCMHARVILLFLSWVMCVWVCKAVCLFVCSQTGWFCYTAYTVKHSLHWTLRCASACYLPEPGQTDCCCGPEGRVVSSVDRSVCPSVHPSVHQSGLAAH